MAILIKNGTIIDGNGTGQFKGDIYVEEGIIKEISPSLPLDNFSTAELKVIDATDQLVVPGLIDIHVHLREPGEEFKENINSGTRAAAIGGFTAVACMPNTKPAIDTRATAEMIKSIAAREAVTRVYPIGAITKGREGVELTEFHDLKEAGVKALSDDGSGIMKADVMRRALEYSLAVDLPLICHCEDSDLAGNGVMNEGYWSIVLGLPGIPALAEELMIARDIELAKLTNGSVHIAHISTKGAVQLVREAKEKGIKVTAEVAPHHLVLTDEAVQGYNTNTKVNPPLRSKEDIEALIKGLQDGVIDVIATDHAPHTIEEKNQEYVYAPFGLVGLETSLGIGVTYLVKTGHLSYEQLIEKMAVNPANILKIPGGRLNVGAVADITIIDYQKQWTVHSSQLISQGKNTPFDGWELTGKAVTTIVGGKIVVEDGKLTD